MKRLSRVTLRSATARARLENDGRLTIELAMTDIGTGSYTILTQIAAETMEMPVEMTSVKSDEPVQSVEPEPV